MGSRGISEALQSYRVLESSKRKNELKAEPAAIGSSLQSSTSLGSKLESTSSASPVLSTSLSQALTFNQLPSSGLEERKSGTEGFGSRDFAVTNSDVQQTEQRIPKSELFEANVLNVDTVGDLSQKESLQIRSALYAISKDLVLTNPEATTDDLQTAIDDALGEGTAEIFNARIEDVGGGVSNIRFDQVEQSEIDVEEKGTLKVAAANALQNYEEVQTDHALKGDDVSQLIGDLRSIVGVDGTDLVADLQKSLNSESNIDQAIQSFKDGASELQLSKDDQEKVLKKLEELKKLNDEMQTSFDSDPLADDFSIAFTSNRYGPAFDSDTIDDRAALTENAEWLSSHRMTMRTKP